MTKKRIVQIVTIVILLVFFGSAILVRYQRSRVYKEALSLYNNRNYSEAAVLFKRIIKYEYAREYYEACTDEMDYLEAKKQLESGNYKEALSLFNKLGDYKDSEELFNDAIVRSAQDNRSNDKKREDGFNDNDYNKTLVLIPEDAVAITISALLKDEDSFDYAPKWDINEIVASDDNANKYTVASIQNKKILLYYQEADQEVFFWGKLDKNGQWNGDCIVNVYNNDTLIVATKAYYKEGCRLEYSQLLIGEGEYVYSNRKSNNGVNSGDSWKYSYGGNIENKINTDSFDSNQIVDPSDYSNNGSALISHYHGNTRDGKYNDETGTSYYVAFYDDGTVRTIYYGNFKDGKFNDYSRNAWYITRDRDNKTKYMYYKGVFKEGKTSNSKMERVEFINPITIDFAKGLLENYFIDDELIWDEDSFG